MFPVNHISSCCFHGIEKSSSSKSTVCAFFLSFQTCVRRYLKSSPKPLISQRWEVTPTSLKPGNTRCAQKSCDPWDCHIYLLIYQENQPHVGKGTIHGSYGLRCGRLEEKICRLISFGYVVGKLFLLDRKSHHLNFSIGRFQQIRGRKNHSNLRCHHIGQVAYYCSKKRLVGGWTTHLKNTTVVKLGIFPKQGWK